MIRSFLVAGAAILAVTACTDLGGGVRAPGERGGAPFSVPPETPGAPLTAPMRTEPRADAGTGTGAPTDDATPAPTRVDRDTAPPPPDGETPRPPQEGPRFGVPAQGDEVPLVRVEPTTDADDNGPDLVAYALRTTHAVGTERHTRRHPLRWRVWERNCLQFADQNSAQEAFLAAGGPERDRLNLDPDGDGFACWWDPEPIRRAMRAAGD